MQDILKLNNRFGRLPVQMADLYCLYRKVTLKIMSRSPKFYQLFPPFQQCIYASLVKIPPLVQSIAQGTLIFDISECLCDLENLAKVTKIYQLFPFSQQYIYTSLVKIHPIWFRNHILDVSKCRCDLEN